MAFVLSVNVGAKRLAGYAEAGSTGIDKRPVAHPVQVSAPGLKGVGGSGLIGDHISNLKHHGGNDQAVYAYAREDLDQWARELDIPLSNGMFGENLTTSGIDITNALIGERWQVGTQLVLEISKPRIPCRTFAGWLDQRGWVKTFTRRAVPGAYLRVVTSGVVQSGDRVTVIHRPDHDVTVGLTFRATTLEPELLPKLLAADALSEGLKRRANTRTPYELND